MGRGMVWMRLRGRNVDQDSYKDNERLPLHVLNTLPSCIFLISSQREVSFHTGDRGVLPPYRETVSLIT